jgi:hypothetical protein
MVKKIRKKEKEKPVQYQVTVMNIICKLLYFLLSEF